MKAIGRRWVPVLLMGGAAIFIVGLDTQRAMTLRAPLASAVPREVAGLVGREVALSEAERRVAGVTDYLMRYYETPPGQESTASFSLYIGYYAQQSQGTTIHSPKNCLPGSGWQVMGSYTARIDTADGGSVVVNRYVLKRGKEQALVLYWYQGRGRVQANEYVVKWDLLRDAALRGRSDEALIRIVVPITADEDGAFQLAARATREIVPAVAAALPG